MTHSAPTNELALLAAGKRKSVLLGFDDDYELETICSLLNGDAPAELSARLRKLVDAWQRSGPNLQRLLDEDKALFNRVRAGRTLLVPTDTGKGHLLWLPTPRGVGPLSLEDIVLSHFMDLIVNPKCHKLGGPCHRCGKYYIKKTSRQKVYCSRRCGSMSTALDRTRKRRHEEHEKKLLKAQQAAERWTSSPTRRSWKKWVWGQTRITVKWLTRAANAGSLKPPADGDR